MTDKAALFIRAKLRGLLPFGMRQRGRALLRRTTDHWNGVSATYGMRRTPADPSWLSRCEVSQPIRRSAHWEGKLANLKLGAGLVETVSLDPGQVFSFWHYVGKPVKGRGFATGRSIQSGRILSDTGGGLCQLSGLCYELALRSGMRILERFPHSYDLYDDMTRFTPLGLDATVVWGIKDLRFRNDHSWPVLFSFHVSDTDIVGRVISPHPFEACELVINVETDAFSGAKRVKVSRDLGHAVAEVISLDIYRSPPPG